MGRWTNHPRRCTATAKGSRERCERLGHPGTEPPICIKHGAAAPQVKRKAQQRLALQEAVSMARSILGPPAEPLEPLDALIKAQQHCEAMILTYTIATDAIREKRGEGALTVTDMKGATTAHPYVVELRHWNDQLRQIASGQLRADIDERRAKVSELQLEQMRKRIEGFMRESGRDLTDPSEVRLIQRWFTGEMPSEPAAIEAKQPESCSHPVSTPPRSGLATRFIG